MGYHGYEDEDGEKICTVEQRLLKDTGHVSAVVVSGGQKLHVKCFASEDYLDTDDFAGDCPMEKGHADLQRNVRQKAVRETKESNQEDIIDEFEVKLPFKCEECFCTKIDPDGFYINYKHATTLFALWLELRRLVRRRHPRSVARRSSKVPRKRRRPTTTPLATWMKRPT